jgi:hypothetical protein
MIWHRIGRVRALVNTNEPSVSIKCTTRFSSVELVT